MSTGVDGLGALKGCQKKCLLPVHYPVKDNDTRWSGSHDQARMPACAPAHPPPSCAQPGTTHPLRQPVGAADRTMLHN